MKRTNLFALEERHYSYIADIPFHQHDFHELVYYVSANGTTTLGEASHTFGDGLFAVIPPGLPHDERHTTPGALFCVQFETECPLPTGIFVDADRSVLRVLRTIQNEIIHQAPGYRDMIYLKAHELTIYLERASSSKRSTGKDLQYSINYIRANYHEKICFSDLARHMHLSYDYFRHCFAAQTGRSPQQFLTDVRLEAARRLLKGSDKSCTEIAYLCGFSTSAQLSMMFRKAFRLTPMQYRNNVAEEEA